MYINLKEIYEDYPDDYDKICELLCKYMSKNPILEAIKNKFKGGENVDIKNYCSSEIAEYIECLAIRIKIAIEKERERLKEYGYDDKIYIQLNNEICILARIKEDLEGISHKLLEGSYWNYLTR